MLSVFGKQHFIKIKYKSIDGNAAAVRKIDVEKNQIETVFLQALPCLRKRAGGKEDTPRLLRERQMPSFNFLSSSMTAIFT